MSRLTRLLATGLTATAALAATAAPAGADGRREPTPTGDLTSTRCQPLPARSIAVTVLGNGNVRLSAPDDGVPTCNEIVVVTSYAGSGVIDSAAPVLEQVGVPALDLEAAGPSGVTVPVALDPCWPTLQVHRDGDTFVWEDVWGGGCELTVESDFPGSPWPTEVHVVQQTGNIQPPHILYHDVSQTTVLTGLPDGTWYVKIYDGALAGSTLSVDGGPTTPGPTVDDVADGATVTIEHPWMDTDV